MGSRIKLFFAVTIFSIAMGYLESAVVIYLRELYYPHGFSFPMVATSTLVLKTELLRELATVIMLACIGWMAGRTKAERFVYFLYSFAIWDIFYYVFLKALLDWPTSFFTWDILFLIPVPWYGPVLAPCMISLTMITFTLLILYTESKNFLVRLDWRDWTIMIIASMIFILSFTLEFFQWYTAGHYRLDTMGLDFIPHHYPWWLFGIGELILLIELSRIYRRYLTR